MMIKFVSSYLMIYPDFFLNRQKAIQISNRKVYISASLV